MDRLKSPNRSILEAVAAKIRPLLEDVVFVGGQVVDLFLTDPAATRMRPTVDVDVIVRATTRSEYRRTEARLRKLGFENDRSEGAPICRWICADGHILDLMPINSTILGFSNEWYPTAAGSAQDYALRDDLVIAIPRPAVFLATKLAAFQGRGSDDLLLSHDLEDIITLVAGRPEIVDELGEEAASLVSWVAAQVRHFIRDPTFVYALQGALPDAARMPGYGRMVRERFETICAAG